MGGGWGWWDRLWGVGGGAGRPGWKAVRPERCRVARTGRPGVTPGRPRRTFWPAASAGPVVPSGRRLQPGPACRRPGHTGPGRPASVVGADGSVDEERRGRGGLAAVVAV